MVFVRALRLTARVLQQSEALLVSRAKLQHDLQKMSRCRYSSKAKGYKSLSTNAMPSYLSPDLPRLLTVVPGKHLTAKLMFEDAKSADYKYIWLRDNCKCTTCMDLNTAQKLVDSPAIDIKIQPKSMHINKGDQLVIVWEDDHVTTLDSSWLYRYGVAFISDKFQNIGDECPETTFARPDRTRWNKYVITKEFPEISYEDFNSEDGVLKYLDLFYRYGFVMLKGVPTVEDEIIKVVERYAYVKRTQYGLTFAMKNVPDPNVHNAYKGVYLSHHTDMNYRENSPGMQLLHCLQSEMPEEGKPDPGGRSFLVDGFYIAKYLEENEPSAFHVLSSTPVRFQMKNQGQKYSQVHSVITLGDSGDVTEIHYNNRTMGPLQVPTRYVTPFYHAYKMFSDHVRDPKSEIEFTMAPGDCLAFNNRRIMHGRTAFDPFKVNRHLQGCYVDIDEAFARYDKLLYEKYNPPNELPVDEEMHGDPAVFKI